MTGNDLKAWATEQIGKYKLEDPWVPLKSIYTAPKSGYYVVAGYYYTATGESNWHEPRWYEKGEQVNLSDFK